MRALGSPTVPEGERVTRGKHGLPICVFFGGGVASEAAHVLCCFWCGWSNATGEGGSRLRVSHFYICSPEQFGVQSLAPGFSGVGSSVHLSGIATFRGHPNPSGSAPKVPALQAARGTLLRCPSWPMLDPTVVATVGPSVGRWGQGFGRPKPPVRH